MKRNVSVVRLIVATRSSNILISGKIIKEMPGSVTSETHFIRQTIQTENFRENEDNETIWTKRWHECG